MKTKIVALVLSVFAVLLSGYTLAMQNNLVPTTQGDKYECVDSLVATNVQNIINPLFGTTDEVLSFRLATAEGNLIDSEFNEMPEDILKNVAGVLIKREGPVSKRAIIYEYRSNKQVYDNLPNKLSSNSPSSTEGDSVRKPVDQIQYSQHDTTIDGKMYKIHKRTEVTYENN